MTSYSVPRSGRLRCAILCIAILTLAGVERTSAQATTARLGDVSTANRLSPPADQRGPVIVRGGGSPDPILHAVEEYRRTGAARTIRQSSVVVYPYGHAQPTLTCVPLRACVVELESGEVLMSLIAGDTERWLITEAFTGANGDTPLVVVKPTNWDLTTNLLITTDRRIYELTLDSPPARDGESAQNPQGLYTRRIQYYYPDDMVRAVQQRQARLEQAAAATIPVMNPDFTLENLNFGYRVLRDEGFPFEIEQVFDDGAHTYIKLPSSARHDVSPVLFLLDGGQRQILNYTIRGPYYITDRVIGHGVLVVGGTKKNWLGRTKATEYKVRILNIREGQ